MSENIKLNASYSHCDEDCCEAWMDYNKCIEFQNEGKCPLKQRDED